MIAHAPNHPLRPTPRHTIESDAVQPRAHVLPGLPKLQQRSRVALTLLLTLPIWTLLTVPLHPTAPAALTSSRIALAALATIAAWSWAVQASRQVERLHTSNAHPRPRPFRPLGILLLAIPLVGPLAFILHTRTLWRHTSQGWTLAPMAWRARLLNLAFLAHATAVLLAITTSLPDLRPILAAATAILLATFIHTTNARIRRRLAWVRCATLRRRTP